MMTRTRQSNGRTKKDGLRIHHSVLMSWRGIILLVVCCSCNSVRSHAASSSIKQHRNMQFNDGSGNFDVNTTEGDFDVNTGYFPRNTERESTCPTGEPRTVVINTSTGEWKFLEMNDDEINTDADAVTVGIIRDNNEGLLSSSDFNSRRMLRKGSDALGSRVMPVDPLFMGGTDGDAEFFHRAMSTDGSNSLATVESGNGNEDDGTTLTIQARTCDCYYPDNGGVTTYFTFCPEISDWCAINGSDPSSISVSCYRVSQIDVIARNIWPLLWLWYGIIFFAILCNFQGRILLDFIKGTILYYICGCGDRFQNRELRSIDRYNHSIVEEIVNEERIDRDEVRRARNNGSAAGRLMNAIDANHRNNTSGENNEGVPPTIVTSTSLPAGGNGNANGLDSDDETTDAIPSFTSRIAERFRNIVWPWQTSWKRYIKYNLLMRVEWIAMREEVDFIESRQERGLPHTRYEMKTRRWNAATEGGCGCSAVGDTPSKGGCSFSQNSVDEPHCTICFSELEDGDKVGDLGCRHVFHTDCLKMWVAKRNSCPLCNIPVARRKRISSEELVKEDLLRQKSNADELAAAAATHHSNVYGSNGVTNSLPSNNSTAIDSSSDDYDHTLPPTEGNFGSPSHQQRREPRRLSHMPMTPSTVAASNYSDDDFDHMEAVDLGRAASPPSPNEHDEIDRVSPTATATATSAATSAIPTTTTTGRIARISDARISEIHENENVDEDVDESCPASSSNNLEDNVGCNTNINDYLSRDSTASLSSHAHAQDDEDEDEYDHCAVHIPSPPRRIRRRSDENDDEITTNTSCGVVAYSPAFAPTTEEDDDDDNPHAENAATGLPALDNNSSSTSLSLVLSPERDPLQIEASGNSTDPHY